MAGAGGAGGAAGRGAARRAAPNQAQASHELRTPPRFEPRRGEPQTRRSGGEIDDAVQASAPAPATTVAAAPSATRATVQSSGPTTAVNAAASAEFDGASATSSASAASAGLAASHAGANREPQLADDVPPAWREIVAALHQSQPALGAVLEHGVPVRVERGQIVLSFPEGSFFGRQAMSDLARQALGDAAARVLGQRPQIEIGFGLSSNRPTVAAQEAARRQERRAEVTQAALSHPRVKDALDVFPEAEGHVNVEVED
jgi:hypothetical protein